MITLEQLNERGKDALPGHLGIVITQAAAGEMHALLAVQPKLMAPNGYLHAGTVVSLADTACGYGCVAKATHLGRTTQLWDAVVTHRETGKTIALFRCTQLVIYPKAGA